MYKSLHKNILSCIHKEMAKKLAMKNVTFIVLGSIALALIVTAIVLASRGKCNGAEKFNAPPAVDKEEDQLPVQGNVGTVLHGLTTGEIHKGKVGGTINFSEELPPELNGVWTYGFSKGSRIGNEHGLHTYGKFVDGQPTSRICSKEGQDASHGCCEFVPPLYVDKETNTCQLSGVKPIKDFRGLPNWQKFVKSVVPDF